MNVILKARQLGFSTFIDIFILDFLLFNREKKAGIVAHTLDDAKSLFETKIKFPYDNLPGWLREQIKTTTDSKTEVGFENGSGVKVGTSLRGGTFNILHVSEFGKLCHKFPEKAKEIVTGAFNTIDAGQIIFVESTHEGGKGGHFYDLCKKSMGCQGKEETALDFRFHFFPWHMDSGYVIEQPVTYDQEVLDYFDKINTEDGVVLSEPQRAWYQKKWNTLGFSIYQEYPTTPPEAFMVEISGAFYSKQITKLRQFGQITNVPYDDSLPVYTAWDLGLDCTSIIFIQISGREPRIIKYYENDDIDFKHYVHVLNDFDKKYQPIWGKDLLPHDGKRRSLVDTQTTVHSILERMGRKVERVDINLASLMLGIEYVRQMLPMFLIDKKEAERLVDVLEGYRQGWNEKMNCWNGEPVHDWASHGSDALRVFCVAIKHGLVGDHSTFNTMEQNQGRGHMSTLPDTAIDDDYDPIYG